MCSKGNTTHCKRKVFNSHDAVAQKSTLDSMLPADLGCVDQSQTGAMADALAGTGRYGSGAELQQTPS